MSIVWSQLVSIARCGRFSLVKNSLERHAGGVKRKSGAQQEAHTDCEIATLQVTLCKNGSN